MKQSLVLDSIKDVIELNDQELVNTDGGVLPIIAAGVILKGFGIGFGACAALFGAVHLGRELSKK
jgi:lactobin A/cerein 7B family class IIb bacteriocin